MKKPSVFVTLCCAIVTGALAVAGCSSNGARNSSVSVTGVTLDKSTASVTVGNTTQLTATISPANATNQAVTWSSGATGVATVDSSGTVTSEAVGTATITATTEDGGYTASCTVRVTLVDMVAITGGTFNNGTADMTVSSFYIGKYEVTQKQYATVMGSILSYCSSTYGLGDDYPVYYVTWYDAVAFCNALSELEGYDDVYTISGTTVTADFTKNGYRLPTEAEWQFAARGGTSSNGYTYSGSNTIDDVAWNTTNSSNTTHTVGGKTANELGLYDMSGNVREWCEDWYETYPSTEQSDYTGPSTGVDRVERGGSWYSGAIECAVSYRSSYGPSGSFISIGFRVARSPR